MTRQGSRSKPNLIRRKAEYITKELSPPFLLRWLRTEDIDRRTTTFAQTRTQLVLLLEGRASDILDINGGTATSLHIVQVEAALAMLDRVDSGSPRVTWAPGIS